MTSRRLLKSILLQRTQALRFSTQVFDRQLKKRQRQFTLNKLDESSYYNYLRHESSRRLLDRVEDITKTFPEALEIGCYDGFLYDLVNEQPSMRSDAGGIGGIERLTQCDYSYNEELTASISREKIGGNIGKGVFVKRDYLQCDEEFLPFRDNSFDIILSSLHFHWTNDLQNTFRRINDILRPDGVFIASVLGNDTLKELRHCFYLAETERKGGVSLHTSPLILSSDVAALMQSSNFNLPTIDVDTVTVSYPNAFVLMEHISRMGEGMAALNRQYSVGKDTMIAMASIYQDLYGMEDGSVPATFEFIYMIGWKHHESQQKPCKRGSASRSLKELSKDSQKS